MNLRKRNKLAGKLAQLIAYHASPTPTRMLRPIRGSQIAPLGALEAAEEDVSCHCRRADGTRRSAGCSRQQPIDAETKEASTILLREKFAPMKTTARTRKAETQ